MVNFYIFGSLPGFNGFIFAMSLSKWKAYKN